MVCIVYLYLFSHDWTICFLSVLLFLSLSLSLPLPFCFPSYALTQTHTSFLSHFLANCLLLRAGFCGKGGVILRSQPSVRIFLQAQQDFLICVTNTNAFKFPQPWLLTSFIPCNALFTSSPAPPSHPTPHTPRLHTRASRIRRGTATHDFPGRKSIRP